MEILGAVMLIEVAVTSIVIAVRESSLAIVTLLLLADRAGSRNRRQVRLLLEADCLRFRGADRDVLLRADLLCSLLPTVTLAVVLNRATFRRVPLRWSRSFFRVDQELFAALLSSSRISL